MVNLSNQHHPSATNITWSQAGVGRCNPIRSMIFEKMFVGCLWVCGLIFPRELPEASFCFIPFPFYMWTRRHVALIGADSHPLQELPVS